MFQIHVPSNTSLTVVSQAASGSPLFTISKEGDESAKNVDIINYF